MNGFVKKFDSNKAKEAMDTVKDSIKEGLSKAISKIDKDKLAEDIKTLLKGLPWGTIATAVGVYVGGTLATGIFGSVFKKTATNILTNLISSKLGIGAAGKAGASAGAGAASSAGAGAGIGAGGAAGLGIMGGMLGLGLLMRKYADDHGGTDQLKGTNMGLSTQTTIVEKQNANNQALSSKGMNAAGQYTSIQAPTPTNTQSTNTVKTVMTGEKDPSFTVLEQAKAALMANPIIKKLMDGKTSKDFDTGYAKYTNTNKYNVSKQFGASEKGGFSDKYGKYVFTTKKDVSKNFAGKETGGFVDKYNKYVFTASKNVTKNFNGKETGDFSGKYSKYIFTASKNVSKNYAGTESGGFSSKLTDYKYTTKKDVTKTFYGKDGGNFISYFNKFTNDLYNKTVKVTFDIVTTAKNVVASILGKGREILASIWTENARGGLFTGPVGFQVFGEAGAEAAIPLERKSTMKRIGSAIANAGGMGNSNSDEIADAIAIRVIPAIAQMMNNQNQRPIAVNAVLYTENDEVLARSVNRGQRILDKRYNPVSQFSY